MQLPGSRSWRWRVVLATSALAVGVAGCGTSSSPAQDAADRFERAVSEADWSTACTDLAPKTRAELEKSAGTSCPAALEDEDLPEAGPAGPARRFGTMAQVSFRQDTVFLGEFPDGWKVVAAGCSPVTGEPYDCRLQGS